MDVFDFSRPFQESDLARLRQVASEAGFFYARHPLFGIGRCEAALGLARAFFALPEAEKRRVAIERSSHFRGYSEMRNVRDWREQIHFGRECDGGGHRLDGPNLWPEDGHWRAEVLRLLSDFEEAGRAILETLARCLGVSGSDFLGREEQPYLLLKMIHYLVPPDGLARSGVAPHVDFSWITLLLQDGIGGLAASTPAGVWSEVEPVPGTLVVNLGEILQFASGGYFLATPHRVVSRTGDRVSLPFFLNPGLGTRVAPVEGGPARELWPGTEAVHVHRVMPVQEGEAFCFGEAEWRRKGEGIWCRDCVGAAKP